MVKTEENDVAAEKGEKGKNEKGRPDKRPLYTDLLPGDARSLMDDGHGKEKQEDGSRQEETGAK